MLCRLLAVFAGLLCVLGSRAPAAPFLSEFHAENVGPVLGSTGNVTGRVDINGNATDWIEVRNPVGEPTVNLLNWALSDDPDQLDKWKFPSVNLAGNSQLLVFASGKDRAVAGVELHTNFKLPNSGVLLLSQPDGMGGYTIVHQIGTIAAPYPPQKTRFSYGHAGSLPAGQLGYFETQTPLATNSAANVTTFVADTTFSVDRGFYETAQDVLIATPTLGATLIYTTDGSEPTTANGTQVPAANAGASPAVTVNVPSTRPFTLRARAIKAGVGATDVDTHTYIFPSAVLTQSTPPLAALAWGGSIGPDWAMDPDVINHADPESKCVADDLKAIPTISVVMDWRDLFGSGTAPFPPGSSGNGAIYPPASGVALEGAERRASIELINPKSDKVNPNVEEGFQTDSMIEIFGGTSQNRNSTTWNSHKLSFKVGFLSDLNFNLYGDDGAGRFDNMILDARYNNVWHYGNNATQRARSDYYGDAFTGDMQRYMSGFGTRAQPVHVYLNGMYWGMYIMHERPDEHFTATYLGGDESDWDIVKHGKNETNFVVAGKVINPAQANSSSNNTAGVNYNAMLALVAADLTNQANFDAAAAKIDLPALADYILINFYFGNTDWSHHNWYASYNRNAPQPKWQWHSWDAEHIMESNGENVTGDGENGDTGVINAGGPGYVHHRLALHPEYRMIFADAVHRHFFNGGLLTYPRVWQLFDARMQVFSEALRAESARWGDNRDSIPRTRGTDWLGRRSNWQNSYFPARSNQNSGVLAQIKARPGPLYPTVAAPVFNQHGGNVAANFNLVMANPGGAGTIRYTMDGSDPRLAGGGLNPNAITYTGAVSLGTSRAIKARVLNGSTWSALNEAYFSVATVAAEAGNLVISKIHYRPAAATAAESMAGFSDRSDFEFVEVMNVSANRVRLDGVSFSAGLDITPLPGGVRELDPGQRALYVANKAAFEFRYETGLPIAGTFALDSELHNDTETLTLVTSSNAVIFSVAYEDDGAWPSAPDGGGPSLVLIRPGISNPTTGASWRQSTTANGSPGADDRLFFAQWQAAQFPGGGATATATADPDGDGLPNLAEFGLGTDPHVFTPAASAPSVSVVLLDVGQGPKNYLLFSIRSETAAEELTWTPESAAELPGWSSAPADVIPVGAAIDHGDGTLTRRYRAPQPLEAGGSRFFRARVTGP